MIYMSIPFTDIEVAADVLADFQEAMAAEEVVVTGLEFCPNCCEAFAVETRGMDGVGECPVCYGRTIQAAGLIGRV